MSFSRAGNEIETSFQDRNSVNVNTTSFVSMKKRCVECSYVPGTKFCRIQVPLVFDDNQGDFVKSTSGRIVDQATDGVDSPPYSATSPAYYPPSPIYNAALIKDSSCNATSFAYYPVSPSYTVAPTEAPKSPPYSATSPAYYPLRLYIQLFLPKIQNLHLAMQLLLHTTLFLQVMLLVLPKIQNLLLIVQLLLHTTLFL